jgi:hypothetical protein
MSVRGPCRRLLEDGARRYPTGAAAVEIVEAVSTDAAVGEETSGR